MLVLHGVISEARNNVKTFSFDDRHLTMRPEILAKSAVDI
jgi:hypothetical protein